MSECKHGANEYCCEKCEIEDLYNEIEDLKEKLRSNTEKTVLRLRSEVSRMTSPIHRPAVLGVFNSAASKLGILKNHTTWK